MAAERDARHQALAQIGADGQQRIADGSVLLIGAGGIGCAVAAWLAAAGVGRLAINDFDRVDATNLGRQVLYAEGDIGKLKAEVATERLREQNPAIRIDSIAERLHGDALLAAIGEVDLVVDGCDNFATRFAVSDACVARGRRLLSGAAIRFEGQLAVFGPDYAAGPCYRCLYSDADESLENCAGNGVLSPVPGVIGTLLAVESLKSLAGIGQEPGVLRLYDAMQVQLRSLRIPKRAGCSACG